MRTPGLEPAPRTVRLGRVALPLIVLLATLAVSATFLLARRPLGQLDRLTDEWLILGLNLARQGTLGVEREAAVFRAPGYPFFIACVLRLFTQVPSPETITPRYGQEAALAVCLSQCVLLAIAAVSLFAWLRRRVRTEIAFAAALMFGVNPYCVALCGLLHYDVLHMCLLILSAWATDAALARPTRRAVWLAAAGLVFGLTTLVRSVTLILPPFLLLLGLQRDEWPGYWSRAFRRALPLTLGLGLAIAPWTLRNFVVCGSFVPVNAQGWMAVWGSTVRPLPRDANRYLWYLLANSRDYLPIYSRVTGGEPYSYEQLVRYNLELEQAFKQEALRNMRERPAVYLHNAARSFVTFNLDVNSALLAVFERLQAPDPGAFQRDWPMREDAAERRPTAVSRGFAAWVSILTVMALGGAIWAWARRKSWVLVPIAVYACLCVAHTLTYMDFMYYYVKLPLLVVLAAAGCDALADLLVRRLRPARATLLAPLPAELLALAALALSAWLWMATSTL
jgi:hypothetical protein